MAGDRRRVLVADDEDFIALLLAELLEDLDLEVDTAFNGRDALAMVEQDPPDLVICDIMMPHTSGVDLLKAMRERDHTSDTPVILMSAAAIPRLEDDRVRFIPKPFNIQNVIDAVLGMLHAPAKTKPAEGDRAREAYGQVPQRLERCSAAV